MRILLAVDGSVCSDRATELVAGLALPPGSSVRVVAVLQPFADALALSYAAAGMPARTSNPRRSETHATCARRSAARRRR